jgi:hypothetical protein
MTSDTILKTAMKLKTILSEKFQNQISKSQKEAKSTPLKQKYMTAHFPGLVQARLN